MREKMLELMKREGLKSSQLAEMLEINPAGISHILAGRNKPGFDLLQKILRRFPQINPDWLLLDSDKIYRSEVQPASPTTKPTTSNKDLFETAALGSFPAEERTGSKSATAESAIPMLPPQIVGASNIKRIIVLYDDQTFESFTPTMR